MEFHKLSEPSKKAYSGHYQGQTALSGEDIEVVLEKEIMSLSDMDKTLRALISNVDKIQHSIDSIIKDINAMKWMMGIGIAFIGLALTIMSIAIALK